MGRLVTALGIAQIVSWGTLFYAIGVLGEPMREALGASQLFLYSAFTAGLLLSAALAPLVGRLVDRKGGRAVLSAGSIAGAAAMLVLAAAPNALVMGVGWILAGAAMAACLYDPAFATLSQHTGDRYRRAVTALTLFGGFASTVFWPLSEVLLRSFGWREAFAIYAGLNIAVCLPIHARLIPPHRAAEAIASAPAAGEEAAIGDSRRLAWLTASLGLATFVVGVMAVHVIALLTSAGLTQKEAVAISVLFGPMQVAGRIVEMGVARHLSAVATGFAAFTLIAASLVALIAVDGFGVAPFAFIVAYGVGNGVLTIVRGTAPAELFGRAGIGTILGKLSRATLLARAIAPAAFSGLLTLGLTRNAALSVLVGFGAAGIACYAAAVRKLN